jgi:hypothetical protein
MLLYTPLSNVCQAPKAGLSGTSVPKPACSARPSGLPIEARVPLQRKQQLGRRRPDGQVRKKKH